MMFVPLALIAIVGSASAQWNPGTARLSGQEYNCRVDINSGAATSFVGGAQQFARCIIAATPDFTSVFNQLASPTGLNLGQFNQYCMCWGQQAGYPGVAAVPPQDDFVDCYNQALGGCVNGNQAAFDQQDNNIWGAVIRFLGLTNQPPNAVALLKSVFTTIDTTGGRQGFRCPYVKSGCVVPTAAPTVATCPCVEYTQRCTDTPCASQTATCGVSSARAGSRTTTCSCLKVTGGNTAAATPVDCCFCNRGTQPGQFSCSTQSSPCPSTPPCVTYSCAAGQWSACSISCSTGSSAGIQTMTQTCTAYSVMDGAGSSAPAFGGAGCAACSPQQRSCSAPACTTFSCQYSPPSACPSLTCGGVAAQSVTTASCIQNPGGLAVPPQLCQANGVQCQGSTQPCPVAPPCVTYVCSQGTWTTCPTCSDNGAAGVRTQSVTCQSFVNGIAGQSVPSSQCSNCIPQSQPCPNVPPCTTYRCNTGQWTPCPTCCSSAGACGSRTQSSTCVGVRADTGAIIPADASQCTKATTTTTVEVSYQPQAPILQAQQPIIQAQQPIIQAQAPIFQPQQPILQPQQPIFQPVPPSFQPQQPIFQPVPPSFQPQAPIPLLVPVAAATLAPVGFLTPYPTVQGGVGMNVPPASFTFGVVTPSPFIVTQTNFQPVPPVAIAQPPVAIAQPPIAIPQPPVAIAQSAVSIAQSAVSIAQSPVTIPQSPVTIPQAPLAIPQAPLAVPVPRQTTVNVPACVPSTEPCTAPVCITYSCSCATIGACGTQTCGQPTDSRASQCTCRTNTGNTVDNGLCGSGCPAITSAANNPSFAPCPSFPPCLTYRCDIGSWTPCPTCCSSSAAGACGSRTQSSTCVGVNVLTGALTPADPSQCTKTQPSTTIEVSYQPQAPTFQQQPPITLPGQPVTQLVAATPAPVQPLVLVQVTPAPLSQTLGFSNAAGAMFDFGSIVAAPVMTPPPPPPQVITLPGQPIVQAQPPIQIAQAPLAVPVPRTTTVTVPACVPSTEPCTAPVCISYSCSCATIGACGTQTCGQQTDSRASQCTCRTNTGNTVANGLCGSGCPAITSAANNPSFAPCPALPCCFQYSCQLGSFSQCSTTCGQGVMTRPATCLQTCPGQPGSTVVDGSRCASQGSCTTATQPCTICPQVQAAPIVQPSPPVYLPGATVTVAGQVIQQPGQTVVLSAPPQVAQVITNYVPMSPPAPIVYVQPPIQQAPIVYVQPPIQQNVNVQPTYALGAFGSTVCPAGYYEITSAATCRAAAQFLSQPAGAQFSGSWAIQPAGCIYDNNGWSGFPAGVYYNDITKAQGAADANTALICSTTWTSTAAASQYPGWAQRADGSWYQTGSRRSRHAASTPEQSQAPSALVLAVGAVAVAVAVVASAVAVFNRVVNKLVMAELRALQA